jgi:hypothetical protein
MLAGRDGGGVLSRRADLARCHARNGWSGRVSAPRRAAAFLILSS